LEGERTRPRSADFIQSKITCYLTSLRPNLESVMAEDAVRILFDHLLLLPTRPIEKLDVFLCSNGGSGVLPWRIVSLFREFAKSIGVLIPYRAYSAATMVALGADEIIMHPFGEMGPIDPTVSNDFNPSISKKLQNDKQFDPLADIFNAAAPPQLPPQNQACLVPPGTMFEDTYKYVIVESARLSSAFDAKRRFVVAAAGPQFEPLIRAETLDQQWSHQPAPAPVPEAPQT
jgi:hypothetical protein